MDNLYVHFPFCRRKCSYCALLSRAGSTPEGRRAYVEGLVREVDRLDVRSAPPKTLYFGGGSPALCDLRPLLAALDANPATTEFTVELHPLDVTTDLLKTLRDGGVNRISMGVQSVEDAVLAGMGRGYTFAEAERRFALVREHFENAGIDLIVGYPGETPALTPRHARLAKWFLAHCSVYSLIPEPRTLLAARRTPLPSDDQALNLLALMARLLGEIGLERYEISNFAARGKECRHNLAVWRGEDYTGLGEGACGRAGLVRTTGKGNGEYETTRVSPEEDATERTIFSLRTREGIDASSRPDWLPPLDRFTAQGLLTRTATTYRLTPRGAEVCDTILSELV